MRIFYYIDYVIFCDKMSLTKMITIETKNIKNKPFNYLTERFNTGNGFEKIQVYLGKNVPNNLSDKYEELKKKELALVLNYNPKIKGIKNKVIKESLIRLEKYALDWKYFINQKTDVDKRIIFRLFAIQFIFESNSIEGSRLSQDEVKNIIENRYIKKDTSKIEVQEVINSIKAIDFIRSGEFKLNQKNIKLLHSIITEKLGYEKGFKKKKIVVNNKQTVDPKNVKQELKNLIIWFNKNKKKNNPFMNVIVFHNKFERIHPFSDGNGRTGRMLLIWMLMEFNYDIILFRKKNMKKYFKALDYGDSGRYEKIISYTVGAYKDTLKEFIK